MICTFLIACSKMDDNDVLGGSNSGGSNNGLKSGQIEIKAYPDENKKISFYVTAKKITIDWGDGNKDEFTPNGANIEYSHEYAYQNFQTISIVTESITSISFYSYTKGTVHELRFGKCTELKEIYCSSQNLTVLDIKNVVAFLEKLGCSRSQLFSLDVSGASKLKELGCSNNG